MLDAIIAEPSLQMKFPDTPEELKQAAAEFRSRSFHGIMSGCVGAIDGWLLLIRVPRLADVPGGNIRKYFSGHSNISGINVQACCDIYSRFTAVNMSCPGSTADSVAYLEWKLKGKVESLPLGYYVIGDNAYANTDRFLTPYNKVEREGRVYRDAFCYYLSQLRIRVEMAFEDF